MGDGPADQGIGAPVAASFALLRRDGLRGHLDRRALQEPSGLLLRGQQRPDLPLQRLVARARLPQKRVALLGRTLQHRLQQAIDLFPSFRIHRLSRRSVRGRAKPWRCSSRASR